MFFIICPFPCSFTHFPCAFKPFIPAPFPTPSYPPLLLQTFHHQQLPMFLLTYHTYYPVTPFTPIVHSAYPCPFQSSSSFFPCFWFLTFPSPINTTRTATSKISLLPSFTIIRFYHPDTVPLHLVQLLDSITASGRPSNPCSSAVMRAPIIEDEVAPQCSNFESRIVTPFGRGTT